MKKLISIFLACLIISISIVLSASADSALDGYMIGDVDYDSEITATDYVLIKRFVLGSISEDTARQSPYISSCAMDVNADGVVNAEDYLLLKRVVLGTLSIYDIIL